jgi:hypothetical protein
MEYQKRDRDPDSQQDNRGPQSPNGPDRSKPETQRNAGQDNAGNPAFDEDEPEDEQEETENEEQEEIENEEEEYEA